jgi:hypothetical protein
MPLPRTAITIPFFSLEIGSAISTEYASINRKFIIAKADQTRRTLLKLMKKMNIGVEARI